MCRFYLHHKRREECSINLSARLLYFKEVPLSKSRKYIGNMLHIRDFEDLSPPFYTASLLSRKIIRHFLNTNDFIKVPLDPVKFPYISSAPLEICRKVCIICTLARGIIEKFSLDIKLTVSLIHYLFKLMSFNYDVEQACIGRLVYENMLFSKRNV